MNGWLHSPATLPQAPIEREVVTASEMIYDAVESTVPAVKQAVAIRRLPDLMVHQGVQGTNNFLNSCPIIILLHGMYSQTNLEMYHS